MISSNITVALTVLNTYSTWYQIRWSPQHDHPVSNIPLGQQICFSTICKSQRFKLQQNEHTQYQNRTSSYHIKKFVILVVMAHITMFPHRDLLRHLKIQISCSSWFRQFNYHIYFSKIKLFANSKHINSLLPVNLTVSIIKCRQECLWKKIKEPGTTNCNFLGPLKTVTCLKFV